MDSPSIYATRILRDAIYHWPHVAQEIGLREDMPFLGEGAYGAVYALDDRTAVKITRHQTEAMKARRIMNLKLPHVVRIHRVVRLQHERYVIVMERLKPLPKWAFKILRDGLSPDDIDDHPRSSAKLRVHRRRDTSLVPRERKFLRQIDTAYYRLFAHGIRHSDIHRYNIMVNDRNEFKLIDVM